MSIHLVKSLLQVVSKSVLQRKNKKEQNVKNKPVDKFDQVHSRLAG